MSEADPTEILVVDKRRRKAERLRDVEGVQAALRTVGSVQNITLTQLARNRRLLFVEGDSDFRIIRRFAKKLGFLEVASGADLTPVVSGGFSSWERIRALASGFEAAMGTSLQIGAIFDRDYWSAEELAAIQGELETHLAFSHIHERKEIENYLLVPTVLQRALERATHERATRTGKAIRKGPTIDELLAAVTDPLKGECQAKYIAKRVEFLRRRPEDTSTITAEAIARLERAWNNLETRMAVVPGKVVLSALREKVSESYAVGLTDHRIVSAFDDEEVPGDIRALVTGLERYRSRAR